MFDRSPQLTQGPKRGADLFVEKFRLFPGREVTALIHRVVTNKLGNTVMAAGIEISTALKLLALFSQLVVYVNP
jgi:hypothetical protein